MQHLLLTLLFWSCAKHVMSTSVCKLVIQVQNQQVWFDACLT